MKNTLNKSILLLFTSLLFFVSCEYQEIADAEYPTPKLYMPAAVNGVFTIDNIPLRLSEALETQGQAYRFTTDAANNKLIVPLSAYRSGVSTSGKISVGIEAQSDTITDLIASAKVPAATVILPAAEYSLPALVDIADGERLGKFDLEIDLNYLRSFPDAVFGLGVGISSDGIEVNPLIKTTIVVFHTKILKPVANFTSKASTADPKKIDFTNSSAYGMSYSWDFGDGSAVSTEKSPSHIYAATGTYTVTLTTVGVTGDMDKSVKTAPVTVL